jgi:Domain of unknown function (DUF4340)
MRGVKSLLVLVVVLAGLGAYIYFVESKKPQEAATTAGPKVFSVRADAIDEITVKSSGGDKTTLKKTNGSWQIQDPIDTPADEAEVSGLVTGLATVDVVRTIDENPGDLKQFGLADPRVAITFKTAGGAPARQLLIGDKTAASGDLYAKLPNQKKVFLIAGSFDASFDRSTFDLRQKSLLTFDRDKVDRLTVQSPGKAVVLTRANGEWKIEKPYQAPADYGTVEGLIGRVQTAQMKAITAQDAVDLKPYGLDKPDVSITFGLGASQATLMLGKKADTGTVYAKDASRPMVFTVDSALVEDVNKSADQLRRKDVFEFRAFDATAIQVTRGAETLAFEKTTGQGKDAGETWRETKPSAKDVDASAFDTFLTKLSNLRAQSFVDAGPKTKTGLESPAMVVVVRFDEGRKEERVSFGRVGTDVYASIAGQPGAARIDTGGFEDAVKALDAIR